ncbi:MAG: RdgB/HAM1 family non-canonical purine NTP pyrophosphatase [Candidatus Bilamarchaeaceae archaeon]
MEIYFATSNENKFKEAKDIFSIHCEKSIILNHFTFIHREIRADDLMEVAEEAVLSAYSQIKRPVFVEDTGLFIEALNDFPGPYSGWAQKKIGNDGILKLLEGKNRRARFETVIAFTLDGAEIVFFRGVCSGHIAEKNRGHSGFGYDPIFIPDGYSNTFAENIELKNKLSHRYKSLLLFIEHLKNIILLEVN